MVHTPGAQLLKSCTRHENHAHRAQGLGAPFISSTDTVCTTAVCMNYQKTHDSSDSSYNIIFGVCSNF